MGQLVLKMVTCVTVASYTEPRGPVEESPMTVLSKSGVGETLRLRDELEVLKSDPIDAAFGALPQRMIGVAGEMIIMLTGDERTGLAEVPFMNHPLSLGEVDGVRKIEAMNTTSLMLILGRRDQTSANFLLEYGIGRKEAVLDFAEIQEAHHVLLLGLPVFLQAIIYTFARGESQKREVGAIVPRHSSVIHVDYQSGSILIPGKQPAR